MTNREVYETVKARLANSGIQDAAFEARQLFYAASNLSAAGMLAHYSESASESCVAKMMENCAKRCEGVPLQYLIGKWSFHSIEVAVREGVLIPRSDSEVLADHCIEFLNNSEPTTAIDLCSGTGCIAIAVEKNTNNRHKIFALDKHKIPLEIIKENIALNESCVEAIQGDVLSGDGHNGPFGLIMCNPPYIKTGELASLQREVQHEPKEALDGGEDGLIFYRALCEHWVKRLLPGGMLAVEIGFDQASEVSKIFEDAGLSEITVINDTSGNNRVVSAIKK